MTRPTIKDLEDQIRNLTQQRDAATSQISAEQFKLKKAENAIEEAKKNTNIITARISSAKALVEARLRSKYDLDTYKNTEYFRGIETEIEDISEVDKEDVRFLRHLFSILEG